MLNVLNATRIVLVVLLISAQSLNQQTNKLPCITSCKVLPWRAFLGYLPPVFHLYPACISNGILGIPYPVYPCICIDSISSYYLFCSRSTVFHTASSCIRTHLAVSSCIPLYLTVSHRLENGIWPKMHSKGELCIKTNQVKQERHQSASRPESQSQSQRTEQAQNNTLRALLASLSLSRAGTCLLIGIGRPFESL